MFHVLPALSLRPLMLTGSPFHVVLVETNATSVEAPLVLKGVVVCVVSGVPLMYPRLLTMAGAIG